MNPLKMLKELRNGKDVTCTVCNNGKFEPVNNSDYKTTHGFVCNSCGAKINID